jgi:hypothetical protein
VGAGFKNYVNVFAKKGDKLPAARPGSAAGAMTAVDGVANVVNGAMLVKRVAFQARSSASAAGWCKRLAAQCKRDSLRRQARRVARSGGRAVGSVLRGIGKAIGAIASTIGETLRQDRQFSRAQFFARSHAWLVRQDASERLQNIESRQPSRVGVARNDKEAPEKSRRFCPSQTWAPRWWIDHVPQKALSQKSDTARCARSLTTRGRKARRRNADSETVAARPVASEAAERSANRSHRSARHLPKSARSRWPARHLWPEVLRGSP